MSEVEGMRAAKVVAAYLNDTKDHEYLLSGQAQIRFQPYDWSLNQVAV